MVGVRKGIDGGGPDRDEGVAFQGVGGRPVS